ncbi:fructosamine kinase family protein [Actinoallomurus purpureus]|uniref:fructosamine kinase family protein n=1 Tax=Actinoallomurus purpureus TaxID=478114 RepID=UPI0020928500|nr:fructosamine kinase family protein [Actinoallomurus purpureus]MCO6005312.1 fructosamine kinase family protein [Actinoallomurus purpureus]
MDRLLGTPVTDVADLGTSHEWSLRRVTLADGRRVFVKEARRRIDGLFAAEAAGLRWLREGWRRAAGDQTPGPVLEVLGVDDTTLVLPWIESGAPTPEAAERFGRELALLHGAGAEAYGAPWRGYIASLPLDNTEGSSWPEWYAERRVLPYVRMAVDRGALSADDAVRFERAAARIPDVAGPDEPPARIHGDLWSGNLVWGRDRVWLIDPAAHAGHRETDLAMLALFGAPQLERIVAAYDETAPLADGRRARVPLHQLHPLLVHVVLFGGSYRGQALAAARSVLAL